MIDTKEDTRELLAVIEYALKAEDGLIFLQCWYDGDFWEIRAEWPDAPEEVFWADPLYKRKD